MVDLDAALSPVALVVALCCVFSLVVGLLVMLRFVSLLTGPQEYVSYLRRYGRRVGAYVEQVQHWNGWTCDEDGWRCDDYYQIISVLTSSAGVGKTIYKSKVWRVKPRLKPGDPVIIWIDPQNPARYYMDI